MAVKTTSESSHARRRVEKNLFFFSLLLSREMKSFLAFQESRTAVFLFFQSKNVAVEVDRENEDLRVQRQKIGVSRGYGVEWGGKVRYIQKGE